MSDWLHELPVAGLALAVFALSYLLAAAAYLAVVVVAKSGRARAAFKAVSPGLLSPLGIIFGLFVAFTAAQVWGDIDHALTAVNKEASSLRTAIVLAANFPGDPETRLRDLVRQHIEATVTEEWPMMARESATLRLTSRPLTEALQLTLGLTPSAPGQQIAQREIAVALESALDARRQRIIISHSQVGSLKWTCLLLQALCALLATAMVHCDNRLAAALAMGLFATGVAASVLLIAAHDRPFVGQIMVGPEPLLQVMPEEKTRSENAPRPPSRAG